MRLRLGQERLDPAQTTLGMVLIPSPNFTSLYDTLIGAYNGITILKQ